MDKTPPDLQAGLWRIDPGIHASHVLAYGHRLSGLGYHPDSIRSHIASARHFCAWLNRVGIDLGRTNDGTVRQFAEHDCHCCANRPGGPLSRRYAFRVGRFAQFLADTGVTGGFTAPRDQRRSTRHRLSRLAAPPPGPVRHYGSHASQGAAATASRHRRGSVPLHCYSDPVGHSGTQGAGMSRRIEENDLRPAVLALSCSPCSAI